MAIIAEYTGKTTGPYLIRCDEHEWTVLIHAIDKVLHSPTTDDTTVAIAERIQDAMRKADQ